MGQGEKHQKNCERFHRFITIFHCMHRRGQTKVSRYHAARRENYINIYRCCGLDLLFARLIRCRIRYTAHAGSPP